MSQASITGNALNSYGGVIGSYSALLNPRAYGSADPSQVSSGTSSGHTIGTDVQANLIANLPGYLNLSKQDSTNIGNNLSGVISPDVLAEMEQGAAERGISIGSPTSANASAAFLRALGLNSMQLQQLGHTQLTDAMGRTPVQQTSTTSGATDGTTQNKGGPDPAAAAAANLAAAQAGVRAGTGSIGGVGGGTPAGLPMSGPGATLPGIPAPTTLNSTGSGYDYSNGYVPGSNFNWMNWASNLPGSNTNYANPGGTEYNTPTAPPADPLASIYGDLGINPPTYGGDDNWQDYYDDLNNTDYGGDYEPLPSDTADGGSQWDDYY